MNPILQYQQNSIKSQFETFRKNLRGDPEQIVMGLLNSGKMSRAQFEELKQRAQILQNILK